MAISLSPPNRELAPPATMIIARPGTGREYFEPVIDLVALLGQAADDVFHVAFDHVGTPLPRPFPRG